jgi:N-acetylmuramoyl-L-alanine amidase
MGGYRKMWRIIAVLRAFAVAAAWLGLSLPALAATPQATAARVADYKSGARLVVEVSADLKVQVFTLANPYRVVIDMPEVEWKVSGDTPFDSHGLITGLRFGRFTPTTTRIVLDLGKPAKVAQSFVLAPSTGGGPYRLVVDLEPVAPAEFQRATNVSRPVGKATPAQEKSAVRTPPKPIKRIIVIDPGHGGVDPGTIGRAGTQEKDVTLAVSVELKRQLEATGRYTVLLTRQRDEFMALRDRTAFARNANADLFLSIHADSISDADTRGGSVYTLSERASDVEAAALATKENKADIIGGVDLSRENGDVANILIDLAQRETMNHSAQFANILIDELGQSITLLRNTHRFAGFAVLKAPDVPAALFELGYLSNRTDETLLRKPAHRAKVAGAIVRAIDRYFKQVGPITRS